MTPLISELRAKLGRENVLSAPSELAVYDCDAFTIERHRPGAVVFPRSTKQVAEVVRLCQKHGVAMVPRGAGTSLAGGCLPLGLGQEQHRCRGGSSTATGVAWVSEAYPCAENRGEYRTGKLRLPMPPDFHTDNSVRPVIVSSAVVVMLTRMNKVVEIDLRNRMAVVEAGVPNLRLTQALAGTGFHYAPDPSSQGASTIGGNVATNAGGPHTLKYGVTVNHVLGVEAVLGDGSIVQLGPVDEPDELDLIGLLVGSEGTLGIVTKVWVRLTPNPQDYRAMRAIFNSVDDATNAVSQIIAAGIIPAAMELMDQGILAAVEQAFQFGFPPDAGAVLVIEVDGPAAGLDRQQQQIVEFCRRFGAREVLQASTVEQRELLWKCRKLAVGATGRLSPSYVIQDGVVPRTKLPHIIRRVAEIGAKHQIRIVNVAHAGDGNVHPILLFDERDREQVGRAQSAGREILEECIACGGSITAEHGIGVEKLALMNRLFAPADLEAMHRVRQAFDPTGRLNPGKLIPEREKLVPTLRVGTPGVDAPRPAGVGLSLAKLNRVVDYPADDLTITVEAGMTIAELNRVLAANRQWLPVDVPEPERTTIGEAVSINAAGPRRYAYGTMRDYVLGFTAVDGTGMTFSGGGRVVKNAAGYNMCRLMAGSRGTLGAITQVTLMVRPQSEASVLLACDVASLEIVEKLLAGLVRSPTRPVAIELLAGDGRSNRCRKNSTHHAPSDETHHAERDEYIREADPLFGPMLEGHAGRLYVGFEGPAAEVDWMVGQLRNEWAAAGVAAPMVVSAADAEKLWRWLAEFPEGRQINVLPSLMIGTIAELLKTDPQCIVQAHAGNGVIHTNLPIPMAEDHGEHGPRRADAAVRVMQAIKDRFDPKNILNPGQFVFA
jgi:glycolate oxidase subunit GlcD